MALQWDLSYIGKKATGADGVIEAAPALEGGVLSLHEDILVAHILGSLIDHPSPTLHPDGVTAAEVGAELRTVTAAFVVTALEVLVLIKEDLGMKENLTLISDEENLLTM